MESSSSTITRTDTQNQSKSLVRRIMLAPYFLAFCMQSEHEVSCPSFIHVSFSVDSIYMWTEISGIDDSKARANRQKL